MHDNCNGTICMTTKDGTTKFELSKYGSTPAEMSIDVPNEMCLPAFKDWCIAPTLFPLLKQRKSKKFSQN